MMMALMSEEVVDKIYEALGVKLRDNASTIKVTIVLQTGKGVILNEEHVVCKPVDYPMPPDALRD